MTLRFNKMVIRILKKIRTFLTFYCSKQTLDHLKSIRIYELNAVIDLLPAKGRLLEIGAGTGWQSKVFEECGYNVYAIDISTSNYRGNTIFPITQYDGERIPFEDNMFDIVFSSNVLEHIPHLYEFQNEIHRVSKPDVIVCHVLPSSSWRFYTIITFLLKYWMLPKPHGAHACNSFSEIYSFSRHWWNGLFRKTNWEILVQNKNHLFYTGCSILDSKLSINKRKYLSHIIGSSANIFLIRKNH